MKQIQNLKYKDWIFISYFLILQLLLFYWIFIYEKDIYLLLYFCYHIPIVVIIILLSNKKKLLPWVINAGLLGQLLYLFDFTIAMIIQNTFLNYYEFYLETPILSKILVLVAHLTTPLLLYNYREIEIKKKDLFYSWIYFFIIYFLCLAFMPNDYNVNGVESTYTILDNLPFYKEIYLFYIIWVIVLPTYLIQKIVYVLNLKYSKLKTI